MACIDHVNVIISVDAGRGLSAEGVAGVHVAGRRPVVNHCLRCAADPWVQDSVSTRPWVFCWIRSSPTAAAASWRLRRTSASPIETLPGVVGQPAPHAGVAVGLQLHRDRELVLLARAGPAGRPGPCARCRTASAGGARPRGPGCTPARSGPGRRTAAAAARGSRCRCRSSGPAGSRTGPPATTPVPQPVFTAWVKKVSPGCSYLLAGPGELVGPDLVDLVVDLDQEAVVVLVDGPCGVAPGLQVAARRCPAPGPLPSWGTSWVVSTPLPPPSTLMSRKTIRPTMPSPPPPMATGPPMPRPRWSDTPEVSTDWSSNLIPTAGTCPRRERPRRLRRMSAPCP